MLLLTLQKSKPRASLLILVLLKCVARKKKSQHTVCQIERVQIVWEGNFAGRTLKGESQNRTGLWNNNKYTSAFQNSLKNIQRTNRRKFSLDELSGGFQEGFLCSSLGFFFFILIFSKWESSSSVRYLEFVLGSWMAADAVSLARAHQDYNNSNRLWVSWKTFLCKGEIQIHWAKSHWLLILHS